MNCRGCRKEGLCQAFAGRSVAAFEPGISDAPAVPARELIGRQTIGGRDAAGGYGRCTSVGLLQPLFEPADDATAKGKK